MPARPGGTSIGITYCAVPCSDTLKLPGTAPTGLVTGSGSSGSGPSGVSIGGSAVGVRHCPEPVQYWPLGHEPIAGILTDQDARRSRVLASFPLRSGAQVPTYVPLRCSRKPRQNPSLTNGARA